MVNILPKRLRKEPLIDAIFECRFHTSFPVSSILPGIFYSEFEGEKQLEKLPQSDLPEVIRNSDPNLHYAPLVRLRLQNYSILVGDRSLIVACNLPYTGWNDFKLTIIKLIGVLKKSKLIDKVVRYSMKYVDLIQSNDPSDQVSLANLSLRIGSRNLTNESYQVRMEIPVEGFINIIQIISGAKVIMSDKAEREGVVIDIDTIKDTGNISVEQLEQDLNSALENIHRVNNEAFFDCLTEQTIKRLEPEYE